MAIAVISGLLASTVLTLLLIPSVYSLIDRAREAALGPSPITTPDVEAEAEGATP
jgi:hypothetical protein